MRRISWTLGVCILAGGQAAISASAEEGVSVAPATRFETGVTASYAYYDNYYFSETDEVEANAFMLYPELALVYAPSASKYRLSYEGELGEIDTSSKDDYFDSQVTFNADWRPLTRHKFDFDAEYQDEHDLFGIDRTAGAARVRDRDLDEWNSWRGDLKYTFGAETAKLNWHIRGYLFDKEYDTNRVDPVFPALGTRFLDRRDTSGATGLTYKFSAKTTLLAEVEHREIEYDVDRSPSLNGSLERFLLGLKWIATANTSGDVWIGGFSRDFDSSAREDGSGASWLANIFWTPRTYFELGFHTGQITREAVIANENFINDQYIGIDSRYNLTDRLKLLAGYRFTKSDFDGTAREDDNDAFTLGAEYELYSRYLVRLNYEFLERDSTVNAFDYDRNSLILALNASF